MAYAILRTGKIHKHEKGGAQVHNHRLGENLPEHVNHALTHLNIYTNRGGMVDRLNSRLPEKMRKDAVQGVELLLTASLEFFNSIDGDRARLSQNLRFRDWVTTSYNWLKSQFGENLIDVAVHLDETTPHIHAVVVPLQKDGRLCGKDFLSRRRLIDFQSSYASSMVKFGLERGVRRERSDPAKRNTTIKEFYRAVRLANMRKPFPAPPKKSGVLDLDYVNRLEQYAERAHNAINAMLTKDLIGKTMNPPRSHAQSPSPAA